MVVFRFARFPSGSSAIAGFHCHAIKNKNQNRLILIKFRILEMKARI